MKRPPRHHTEDFIKEKVEVQEPEKTMSVRLGESRLAPFDPALGRIFITGLPGSGKAAFGRALAQRLGMRFVNLRDAPAGGQISLELAEPGIIAALSPDLAADANLQPKLKERGKTFFLMADAPYLQKKLGVEAELSDLRWDLEPQLLAGLDYLLPAQLSEDQLMERALGCLGLPGA